MARMIFARAQDDCAFLRMFEGSFSLIGANIITLIVNGG